MLAGGSSVSARLPTLPVGMGGRVFTFAAGMGGRSPTNGSLVFGLIPTTDSSMSARVPTLSEGTGGRVPAASDGMYGRMFTTLYSGIQCAPAHAWPASNVNAAMATNIRMRLYMPVPFI